MPLSPRLGGVGFAVDLSSSGVPRVRSGGDDSTVVFSGTVPLGRVVGVHLPSVQLDVVLTGAVRTGTAVVTRGDKREPMLLCSRDGGAAVIPPRVLELTILVRGGRLDDDALRGPLLSIKPMREAVVLALRRGTGEVP